MVYVLAVGAAIANALTSILQRLGVEDAPQSDSLHLRLLSHALRRRVWLAGFAVMAFSFVLQAGALHAGQLTTVQPILTSELLFLVVFLAIWFRFRVGLWEWAGAAAAALGLAGFLVFAAPGRATTDAPSNLSWVLVAGACVVVMAIAVCLARVGPRWWRAAAFGSAGAIGFAFTASLTKVVTTFVANDWVSMFRHWQTYGIAVTGLLSVFLAQNAYHAGPIAASQSTLVLVDPLASILIGVVLFGDQLRTSLPYGPLEAASLLVCFAGAVVLCHSPLVSGMKGESGAEAEMLAHRARRRPGAADDPSQGSPALGPDVA